MEHMDYYGEKVTKIEESKDIFTGRLYKVFYMDGAENDNVNLTETGMDGNVYVVQPYKQKKRLKQRDKKVGENYVDWLFELVKEKIDSGETSIDDRPSKDNIAESIVKKVKSKLKKHYK